MARNSKKAPDNQLQDSFGNRNRYYLLGVQDDESLFPFLLKMSKHLKTQVHGLGEYEGTCADHEYSFSMAFAQVTEPCDVSVVIIENKCSLFLHDGYPTSKKECKLNFHTLSMFDEYCYLLNRQGLTLFNWDFMDCDYLILFYAGKEFANEIEKFTALLKHIPQAKSFFLEEDWFKTDDDGKKAKKDKLKTGRREFFEELFCYSQIQINQWHQRHTRELLSDKVKLPLANIQGLFFDEIYDEGCTPEFNSQFVKFIDHDPSY